MQRVRLSQQRSLPPGAPSGAASTRWADPIAAAVVLGTSGLLVGRRHDGSPPWTLIAGEVESGEQPADTAVREVKEEAGLEVLPEVELGRRVHPRTGRAMVYLACTPVREADESKVHVGDPAELADVRWIDRTAVQEYLPDLYEPVHRHVARSSGDTC